MKRPGKISDVDFMEQVLRQGPATTSGIIGASIRARGHGMTPHSRKPELRRKLHAEGLDVECECIGRDENDRQVWVYCLVPLRCAVVIEAGGQVALAV